MTTQLAQLGLIFERTNTVRIYGRLNPMHWESDRPLPQFVVIGAMKAGTTSLYYYLRRHPEIVVSDAKELDFFIREKNWHRGEEWYRRQFPRSTCRVRGEFSVNYSKFPSFSGVPRRMASCIPNVKIIYLLRNPFSRFIAQYRDHVLRAAECLSLERRLRQKNSEYLLNSDYHFQLKQYLPYFQKNQILLVSTGQLRTERVSALRRIYSFLGVNSRHRHSDDSINHNEFQTKWQPRLLPNRMSRSLMLSAMSDQIWSRKSVARELLEQSVCKLAQAWPQEKWIQNDLSRESAQLISPCFLN
ncbi:MAG: sulfotransferase [Deltaproteobacteria bacterium]|nr:sulfotransferase [Deltaproteobacteria bacterium]